MDPNDSQRVYVAAGIYESGNAAILRSDDQGKTFQQTDVPFKMGGNESGRFNGERLAVDPNRGNILFFGSRRDGLWKSADRGATWLKVEGFPDIITTNQTLPAFVSATSNFRQRFGRFGGFSQQPVGIVSVVFDSASGQGGVPTPTSMPRWPRPEPIFFAARMAALAGWPSQTSPWDCAPTTSCGRPTGCFI